MMAKILIVGCGKVGGILAYELKARGHEVIGVRRSSPKATTAVEWFNADITDAGQLKSLPSDVDMLFFMASPDGRNAEAYHKVYGQGLANVLSRFANTPMFFISSTSVYGQDAGEWVDEDSRVEPKTITGRLICQAEQKVWVADSRHVVVRFSGIYGPGRNRMLDRAKQSPFLQRWPACYTNRIHQQDCAGVLVFLLEKKLASRPISNCYIASDDCPVPEWEVVSWLAKQMECPEPKEIKVSNAGGQNKRCSNRRLQELGYRFIFPDYQSGYREMINNG